MDYRSARCQAEYCLTATKKHPRRPRIWAQYVMKSLSRALTAVALLVFLPASTARTTTITLERQTFPETESVDGTSSIESPILTVTLQPKVIEAIPETSTGAINASRKATETIGAGGVSQSTEPASATSKEFCSRRDLLSFLFLCGEH